MITAILPQRGLDSHGSGDWQASRAGGRRKHKGVDWLVPVGATVLSVVSGRVTKLGYPYADDLSYRYVEVTDPGGSRYRVYYIEPLVALNEAVYANRTPIGVAQDLGQRYPGIPNHVHSEIKRGSRHVDPRI